MDYLMEWGKSAGRSTPNCKTPPKTTNLENQPLRWQGEYLAVEKNTGAMGIGTSAVDLINRTRPVTLKQQGISKNESGDYWPPRQPPPG